MWPRVRVRATTFPTPALHGKHRPPALRGLGNAVLLFFEKRNTRFTVRHYSSLVSYQTSSLSQHAIKINDGALTSQEPRCSDAEKTCTNKQQFKRGWMARDSSAAPLREHRADVLRRRRRRLLSPYPRDVAQFITPISRHRQLKTSRRAGETPPLEWPRLTATFLCSCHY